MGAKIQTSFTLAVWGSDSMKWNYEYLTFTVRRLDWKVGRNLFKVAVNFKFPLHNKSAIGQVCLLTKHVITRDFTVAIE